ncbi:hypothetical protein CgunFtcFv8_022482 [Champsocephalus gunnari]|uniref:ZP domain-containing protein n=1 Tax=Champsocephalus gunnari TaxID=52237 RepID=A0AAN8HXI6_CHAGU|nr:hypothetical protein CgunFtcFv8_022482 [Champsocephalus gunnari]
MYFEAKKPEHAAAPTGAMRMYINTCFITASQDYTSTPKYTVIDNFGCMIDSKVSLQSKCITGTSKTSQKFGMTALIFKDKVSTSSASQVLKSTCDISMGAVTPTAKSKACNYDKATTKSCMAMTLCAAAVKPPAPLQVLRLPEIWSPVTLGRWTFTPG